MENIKEKINEILEGYKVTGKKLQDMNNEIDKLNQEIEDKQKIISSLSEEQKEIEIKEQKKFDIPLEINFQKKREELKKIKEDIVGLILLVLGSSFNRQIVIPKVLSFRDGNFYRYRKQYPLDIVEVQDIFNDEENQKTNGLSSQEKELIKELLEKIDDNFKGGNTSWYLNYEKEYDKILGIKEISLSHNLEIIKVETTWRRSNMENVKIESAFLSSEGLKFSGSNKSSSGNIVLSSEDYQYALLCNYYKDEIIEQTQDIEKKYQKRMEYYRQMKDEISNKYNKIILLAKLKTEISKNE